MTASGALTGTGARGETGGRGATRAQILFERFGGAVDDRPARMCGCAGVCVVLGDLFGKLDRYMVIISHNAGQTK